MDEHLKMCKVKEANTKEWEGCIPYNPTYTKSPEFPGHVCFFAG